MIKALRPDIFLSEDGAHRVLLRCSALHLQAQGNRVVAHRLLLEQIASAYPQAAARNELLWGCAFVRPLTGVYQGPVP
jgi:hypothetical protein